MMNRQQVFLLTGSAILLCILLIFGNTVNREMAGKNSLINPQPSTQQNHLYDTLLSLSKQHLSDFQKKRLNELENQIAAAPNLSEQIGIYNQLAQYWKDSLKQWLPYVYYTAESSKLENSEKKLTFAAQLYLNNMIFEKNSALQNWMAINAKDLLERVLKINPKNDSATISLGACYIFGNIAQPMQGIMPVREVLARDSTNIYAHFVLGWGGKKSGQYDKAIEHFLSIHRQLPSNVRVLFDLAESYELKQDPANALIWYEKIDKAVTNPEMKIEIKERMKNLSNNKQQ